MAEPLAALLLALWAPLWRWPAPLAARVFEARQLAREGGLACPVAETAAAPPTAQQLGDAVHRVDLAKAWEGCVGFSWAVECLLHDAQLIEQGRAA